MDEQLKKEWVIALRSGMFQQTQGALRITLESQKLIFNHSTRPVGHCCLGVLIEMRNFKKTESPIFSVSNEDINSQIGFENAKILIRLNDLENKSFIEIADYIEKNL